MGALRGVHDEADEVHILDRAARDRLHEVPEPTAGRVEPGRVDKDDLRAPEILDAGDPVARRLGARRDDREFLADEAVQERRLARVRTADEGHEPAPPGTGARLLLPLIPGALSRVARAAGLGPTPGSPRRARHC